MTDEKECALHLAKVQRNASYMLFGVSFFMLVMSSVGLYTKIIPVRDAANFVSPIVNGLLFGWLGRVWARISFSKAKRLPD